MNQCWRANPMSPFACAEASARQPSHSCEGWWRRRESDYGLALKISNLLIFKEASLAGNAAFALSTHASHTRKLWIFELVNMKKGGYQPPYQMHMYLTAYCAG